MRVYTIRDAVAQYFLPIFLSHNDETAKRMFIGSLGDTFRYREGYMLYHIGHFDDAHGNLTACDPSLVLAGNSIAENLDPRIAQHQEAAE